MTDTPTADVVPGFLAFMAFFLLALALWFLMRNMNSRMRRMSYRQQQAHRGKNDPQAGPGEWGDAGGPADKPDGTRSKDTASDNKGSDDTPSDGSGAAGDGGGSSGGGD